VSQCSHITMDIHNDIENDTWLNIQVIFTLWKDIVKQNSLITCIVT
jgi:hypothetical protein